MTKNKWVKKREEKYERYLDELRTKDDGRLLKYKNRVEELNLKVKSLKKRIRELEEQIEQ